ncbi:bifunctional lysylphosphatidylglycerol flippase/synthetase MprF [Melittangium boletus]|uniref:Phosphatidylglycerol lysyltransferase C-terminal domain-containing protein n=1 Tax=Melittangium boletus DSM 14713 TaxID=1294270 RepID=A0A250IE19_9BACT|nr:bifunctional lysylphosphatidylglycerol flippase/synthetase MprF [Melittangium boletus]ATB30089.1 hypothetical protein MEBOL_003544 [Melittangium boletus DSM 14713]
MRPSRVLAALLPLVLLGLAAWVLHRELRDFHWHDVTASLEALPASRLALAVLVTAANYALMSLYDVLALAYVGKSLPYPRVAMTSFIAYAFGNNTGVAMLSSASVRYRLYSSWGLSGVDVTRVAVFCGVTLWLGLGLTGGITLLVSPVQVPGLATLPLGGRLVGAVFLLVALGYVALCFGWRRPLTVRGHAVALPAPRLAVAQLLVSGTDWLLAAAVLFLLMPGGTGLSLFGFIGLYMLGQVAGLISQVPGGLGVFESILLASLSPRVPAPAVLGTLVAWRAVYYLAPFTLAAGVMAVNELLRRREQVSRLVKGARASFGPVVPLVAALGAMLSGAVLLFSGATPTVAERLLVLRRWLPLPLLELSHLLGSLAGVSLLLLARSLQRRLDAAYVLALGLLAGGGLLSLAKGIDFEEASLLFALALALAPFRSQFYRRTSLFAERFSAPWLVAIGAVVVASVWLGFFSYRHVDYSGDLWWHFTFEGDAPRFLRASVGVVGVVFLYGIARLLAPAPPRSEPPSEDALARARPLVARSPESSSHLALVGDKTLLFNEEGTAFLMYGVAGRAWVAMGDPVGGTPEEGTELAWRFRELVDAHHGWTCFYQVSPGALPRYLDLGLSLLKLGEEATVPLADFRLDGPERRTLRHAHHKLEKEGVTFEVVPREGVEPLLPQLRALSDAWLAEKNTREKGFSLGYFSERYLREGPVAVVRQGGELLGFANLWAPELKVELSVDLMRYRPGAPRGVMDHLFVSLMLWGRERGYERFNLGMAPFSGFESHALAPLWQRAGAFLFAHGEHFYNFQGLRQFKEKFHPVWTPRYLATPGGLAFPRVLADIGSLVSRGLTGLVAR